MSLGLNNLAKTFGCNGVRTLEPDGCPEKRGVILVFGCPFKSQENLVMQKNQKKT